MLTELTAHIIASLFEALVVTGIAVLLMIFVFNVNVAFGHFFSVFIAVSILEFFWK